MDFRSKLEKNLVEVANKYDITVEQVENLHSAMQTTWSQIYCDLADCFDGGEDELNSVYDDEAAMIAENTLDADRVTTFCPGDNLSWVYKNADGSSRLNCIQMGEDILRAFTSAYR